MKNKFSKVLAFLLILIMTVTGAPIALAAPATRVTLSDTQVNPHFEGVDLPEQAHAFAPVFYSDDTGTEYLTDSAAAAAIIRDGMEARQETIQIAYRVPEVAPLDSAEATKAWMSEIGFGLFDTALEETDQPTEGDSLRYCYIRMSLGASLTVYTNHTDVIYTYQPTYFTTAAQEAELTRAVDALIGDFAFTAETAARQKADAIYDWLCANVTYDYDNLYDDTYLLKYSAYAAMVQKTAVCEGYAVLFYRLAEEAGLDARVITGDGGGPHAWNILLMGDYYYYLDSTWDAGVAPADYDYYLKGETDFTGHTNDAEYDTVEFRNRYPIANQGLSAAPSHADHSGGTATCTQQAYCQYCAMPYGGLADHEWELRSGVSQHWQGCKNCTATKNHVDHSGGTATCRAKAVCDGCGQSYGATIAHAYGTYVYNNDATVMADGTRTRTCTACGHPQTVTAPGTRLQNPFTDVPMDQYYATPVLWAVSKGVTTGTSATAFSPDEDCTRGQIVTFLWRAAGSPEPQSNRNPFADVPSDQYYYKAVLWAVEQGITTGTDATHFAPDASCTRGQIVTFLWRAKGKPTVSSSNPFGDVSGNAYYYSAVLWAVKNGITNGVDATRFAPESSCTRGQIVTFLYRAYN